MVVTPCFSVLAVAAVGMWGLVGIGLLVPGGLEIGSATAGEDVRLSEGRS